MVLILGFFILSDQNFCRRQQNPLKNHSARKSWLMHSNFEYGFIFFMLLLYFLPFQFSLEASLFCLPMRWRAISHCSILLPGITPGLLVELGPAGSNCLRDQNSSVLSILLRSLLACALAYKQENYVSIFSVLKAFSVLLSMYSSTFKVHTTIFVVFNFLIFTIFLLYYFIQKILPLFAESVISYRMFKSIWRKK